MSEQQKNLMTLMGFTLTMLAMGLFVGWLFWGPDLFTVLEVLGLRLIFVLTIGVFVGLILGLGEAGTILSYKRHFGIQYDRIPVKVERLGLVISFVLFLVFCSCFDLLRYFGTGKPSDVVVEYVSFFFWAGLGFFVVFGVIFLCVTIAGVILQRPR